MDYVLYTIIPKREVGIVKLNEKLISWGGSVFSHDPPQYVTDSNIVFEQIKDTRYFSKIIGEDIADDTVVLILKSDMLYDLEYAVNNNKTILEKDVLLIFLNKLFELSMFYIILVREDEKVKERYRIATKEEIGIRLSESLEWSDPKDILLFKGIGI